MKQTLFTVGPVEMYPESLKLGGEQLPYFRTEEFSKTVLECESSLLGLTGAPPGSRVVLLTASGTGAMEAAVANLFADGGRALVIEGGSFGERFREICEDGLVDHDAIKLEPGRSLDPAMLASIPAGKYKALLLNAHETSTGLLYDVPAIGAACRGKGLLFVVDAISAFLCDELDMAKMGIDVLITSSQKALALPPGLSILVLGPRALEIVRAARVRSHYFGLAKYLKDGERGQTPFTPAVGVVLQLRERLASIAGVGAAALVARSAALARGFRAELGGLPFAVFPERPSNALTALTPTDGRSAYDIYARLKAEYGLFVTPNGGALRDRVFRVGHMGNLAPAQLSELARALKEISR